MKRMFFICFLFANALMADAQVKSNIYKVTQVGNRLTRINGVPAQVGQTFSSIQDIQFMTCQNAYIIAEKTTIHSSVGIGSRCQSTKIVPYVAQEILYGYAHQEIPSDFNHLQNSTPNQLAYNREVPEDYFRSKGSTPIAYNASNSSSELNFNSSDELHNTVVGVIIVGSFQDKLNASNEFLRIQAEGYSAYSATFDEYTRVGIKFQYNRPSELDQMLTVIREKYNPEAFFIRLSNPGF